MSRFLSERAVRIRYWPKTSVLVCYDRRSNTIRFQWQKQFRWPDGQWGSLRPVSGFKSEIDFLCQ